MNTIITQNHTKVKKSSRPIPPPLEDFDNGLLFQETNTQVVKEAFLTTPDLSFCQQVKVNRSAQEKHYASHNQQGSRNAAQPMWAAKQ